MDHTGPRQPALSDSALTLRTGLALSRLSVPALWTVYATLGGRPSCAQVNLALHGDLGLNHREHDLLAIALNQDSANGATTGVVRYAHELDRGAHHPSRPPT